MVMSVYCSLEELNSVPSSLQPPVSTALGGPDTSGLHQGSLSFARKRIMVFFKCALGDCCWHRAEISLCGVCQLGLRQSRWLEL